MTLAGRLPAHTLTVTQMAFSHNDRFLLSVSRDRTWVISQAQEDCRFEVCAKSDKKNGHSRIVWSCAWTPDDTCFATGSRDKTVKRGDQFSRKKNSQHKINKFSRRKKSKIKNQSNQNKINGKKVNRAATNNESRSFFQIFAIQKWI